MRLIKKLFFYLSSFSPYSTVTTNDSVDVLPNSSITDIYITYLPDFVVLNALELPLSIVIFPSVFITYFVTISLSEAVTLSVAVKFGRIIVSPAFAVFVYPEVISITGASVSMTLM